MRTVRTENASRAGWKTDGEFEPETGEQLESDEGGRSDCFGGSRCCSMYAGAMDSLREQSPMKFGKFGLITVILLGSVGCDQVTKAAAREHLAGRGTLSYLGDTIRLGLAENHGAFLGLGAWQWMTD